MAYLLRQLPVSLALVAMLGGCSGDLASPFGDAGMSTAAIDQPAATRIDPSCVALNSKIDALRRDGVTERAAQAAASGKSTTVPVKRASLSQLAELDKANAEFQSKCSMLGPRGATAPSSAPGGEATAPVKTAKIASPVAPDQIPAAD